MENASRAIEASPDAAVKLQKKRTEAGANSFYVYEDADAGFNHGFPSGVFGSSGLDPNAVARKPACIESVVSITGCSSEDKSKDADATSGGIQDPFPAFATPMFAGLEFQHPEPDIDGHTKEAPHDLAFAATITFEARSPDPSVCISWMFTGQKTETMVENPAPSVTTVVSLPLSMQTFGVVPARDLPLTTNQINRNVATIYESSATLLALLQQQGVSSDQIADAQKIADALNYALYHDNQGDLISTAVWTSDSSGSADWQGSLHNAYMAGDIAISQVTQLPGQTQSVLVSGATALQPGEWIAVYVTGLGSSDVASVSWNGNFTAGDIRIAGFSLSSSSCGQGCIVLDGATGGNSCCAYTVVWGGYTLSVSGSINAVTVSPPGYGGFFVGFSDGGKPGSFREGKSTENNGDIFAAFTLVAPIESARGYTAAASQWQTSANLAGDYVKAILDESPGSIGVAWEFTDQSLVSAFNQISQLQASVPFGDGLELSASTLQDSDKLPHLKECLNTPFQCVPERVRLAATNWAIFAEQEFNPLVALSGSQALSYSINFDNQPSATAPAQQVVVQDQLGSSLDQITLYSYDQAGNLTSLTDAKGKTTTFVYDALVRASQRTLPQGMSASTTYAYDAGGNRLSSTMEPGLATYSYDGMNRLISVTNSGRTTEFSYDYRPTADSQRWPKPPIIAAVPSAGLLHGATTFTLTITGANFIEGVHVFLGWSSAGTPSQFKVDSSTSLVGVSDNPDVALYSLQTRRFSPGSGRWISTDDERPTPVRPLMVRMLDSGGANLTVTSEVDPAAEYQLRDLAEREKPDAPLRPLRVRMLDSGGANLTVTSGVNATAASGLSPSVVPSAPSLHRQNSRRQVFVPSWRSRAWRQRQGWRGSWNMEAYFGGPKDVGLLFNILVAPASAVTSFLTATSNAVLGLFTWSDEAASAHREIDVRLGMFNRKACNRSIRMPASKLLRNYVSLIVVGSGCGRASLPGSSISLALLPGSGVVRRGEQPEVAVLLVRAVGGVVAAHPVGIVDARQDRSASRAWLHGFI